MLKIYKDVRVLVPALFMLGACSATNLGTKLADAGILQSYSAQGYNFRVSLTDAPSKDLKSVFVNVLNAELWLTKGGKSGRLVVAKDLGLVDLMKLRNGVLLPMEDVQIPEGATVTDIRLILGSGNYAIKNNGQICNLQTPSGGQSGVKIKLSNPVTISDKYNYSLVIDFDAAKSVVIKGNGGCLLKPVLKVAGFTQVSDDQVANEGGVADVPSTDLTGGIIDGNTTGSTAPTTDAGSVGSTTTSSSSVDTTTSSDTVPVIGTQTATDPVFYDTTSTSAMPPVITDPSLLLLQ